MVSVTPGSRSIGASISSRPQSSTGAICEPVTLPSDSVITVSMIERMNPFTPYPWSFTCARSVSMSAALATGSSTQGDTRSQ